MKIALPKIRIGLLSILITNVFALSAQAGDLNNSIGLLKAISSCPDGFATLMENDWYLINSVTESDEKTKRMYIDHKNRKTKVITYKITTKEPDVHDFLSARLHLGKKVATLIIEKISYEQDPEFLAGCDSSSCFEDVVNYKCKIKKH